MTHGRLPFSRKYYCLRILGIYTNSKLIFPYPQLHIEGKENQNNLLNSETDKKKIKDHSTDMEYGESKGISRNT